MSVLLKNKFNFNATSQFAELRQPARDVNAAYSDANKWLDTLKEYVYIEMGMPHLSDFIHRSAHVQLERLDIFGDLLHERHLMQVYPTTEELDIYGEMDNSGDVGKVFDLVVRFYEHINEALEAFHAATDKGEFRAMALTTEELMLANSRDYTTVLELWARWDEDGGSKTTFDGYVGELTEKEQDNHD